MTHNSFFASYTISSHKSQSDSVEICHFCSFTSAVFIFLNVGLSQSFCKKFYLDFVLYTVQFYIVLIVLMSNCVQKKKETSNFNVNNCLFYVCCPGDGRPSWSGVVEDGGSTQDGLKRSGSFTKLRESIRRSSEKLVRKLKGVGMEETTPRNAG